MLLAMALPEDSPDDFKTRVMGPELGLDKLKGRDSVAVYMDFLERNFGRHDTTVMDVFQTDGFVDLVGAYQRYLR